MAARVLSSGVGGQPPVHDSKQCAKPDPWWESGPGLKGMYRLGHEYQAILRIT